jgi:hypothetical protein
VIKFVSDLRQIGGFFPATPVSSTNKTDRYDIAALLLKVALNKIIPSPNFLYFDQTNYLNKWRWIYGSQF